MKIVPPGADVVPVPKPLTEEPPPDRFCDLVMTGGVASGVVYPWAVLELARAYRFRNIGGTSVGAMAATLAAAAEYGRRTSAAGCFEPLRRLPGGLAEVLADGSTRMLSLFQPAPAGKRLFKLLVLCLRKAYPEDVARGGQRVSWWTLLGALVWACRGEILLAMVATGVVYAVVRAVAGLLPWVASTWSGDACVAAGLLMLAVGVPVGLAYGLVRDVARGIVGNSFGLCKGGGTDDPEADKIRPALTAWLHLGIQASAGLREDDAPLTFRDLWTAPMYPGARRTTCTTESPVGDRAINLEVLTSNLSHGRPYRLPMLDETSRIFYRREELVSFFPATVLQALVDRSRPYAPKHAREPAAEEGAGFLELPGADLPIVVAARMSLSFPLLFSALPFYAVDSLAKQGAPRLRRCWFSDGGLSSNFPIHLFDAAVPAWPTFGMWLGTRDANPCDRAVWLPDRPCQGREDTWQAFVAGDPPTTGAWRRAKSVLGLLGGAFTTAKDWADITSMRLPHMRCRVARLGLRPNEGALNIAMPREQILGMAHEYGTATGQLFRKRYASADGVAPTTSWQEQRWTRFQVLANGLRAFLANADYDAESAPLSVPLRDAIQRGLSHPPLRNYPKLNEDQAAALVEVLDGLRDLETRLGDNDVPQHVLPLPISEIRSRPAL